MENILKVPKLPKVEFQTHFRRSSPVLGHFRPKFTCLGNFRAKFDQEMKI